MIRVFLTNPDQGFMDDMDDPFSSCPASHYGINHIETSKKMIINGLEAGMISKLCVSHEIKLYLLNVLSIRPIPMTRKFDYYFRRENTLYPSIDAIRDILMDLFSSKIFRKRILYLWRRDPGLFRLLRAFYRNSLLEGPPSVEIQQTQTGILSCD